jgi:hypothetical protein
MSDEPYSPDEFDEVDPQLSDRLRMARPIPPAGFRGRLGRHLDQQDPGYSPRPARLRLIVAGYLGAGGLLIALVAVGLS